MRLFVTASLFLALITLVVPFSVAEEVDIEEQQLFAKAELGGASKAAVPAVRDNKAVVFKKDFILSSDHTLRFKSGGTTMIGNQRDSAGVAVSQLTMNVLEYKAKAIGLEDILPSISTISSDDKKTLGVVLPPFVYLGKRF